jgi:hypothetical protein
MGSSVEVNDTLQITPAQGFPKDILDFAKHQKDPVTLDQVKGKLFHFKNKPRPRLFHLDSVRVFLVENIDGKWLHWGHIYIQSQQIDKQLDEKGQWNGDWVTSGTYHIVDIYEPDYQRLVTPRESPAGRSYL